MCQHTVITCAKYLNCENYSYKWTLKSQYEPDTDNVRAIKIISAYKIGTRFKYLKL